MHAPWAQHSDTSPTPPPDAGTTSSAVDTDNDGYISKEEVAAAATAGQITEAPEDGVIVSDMFMEGVARHTDRILPTADFYAAAANGSLPEFSWVRP